MFELQVINEFAGTFFEPDVGACGFTNGPNDLIVAVSAELFDTFFQMFLAGLSDDEALTSDGEIRGLRYPSAYRTHGTETSAYALVDTCAQFSHLEILLQSRVSNGLSLLS